MTNTHEARQDDAARIEGALEAARDGVYGLDDHDEAMRALRRLAVARAQVERMREALALALTMIERAQFDAHDREWALASTKLVRAAVPDPEEDAT